MERWRWLPHDLGPFYVNVNVPEFMARVVQEGKVIHATRVVVGTPDKQTPIFSDEMQEIVFGPYWNVPTSIKVEEIRPINEETPWLALGGSMEHLRVPAPRPARQVWRARSRSSLTRRDRIDIRNLEIFQPPGPDKRAGQDKFVLPQRARCLHARYYPEGAIRQPDTGGKPRLRACTEFRGPCGRERTRL